MGNRATVTRAMHRGLHIETRSKNGQSQRVEDATRCIDYLKNTNNLTAIYLSRINLSLKQIPFTLPQQYFHTKDEELLRARERNGIAASSARASLCLSLDSAAGKGQLVC